MGLTYAIGDIHGCLDKLQRLVAHCEAHADRRPATFVFLGDYIDRGPDSSGVIGFLIDLQARMPERVVTIMGNHEATALAILNGERPVGTWLRDGGATTLQSYGAGEVSELPRDHIDWLRALRFSYDDGKRFFVHAGVDPKQPLDDQDEFDLLWIREPFLSDPRDYGRLIVHGHTPMRDGKPDLRSNRLDIDTAAVYGGLLTAAVFDDAQTGPLTFLQVD
jgi:serine/threonine protein phosphatase 1